MIKKNQGSAPEIALMGFLECWKKKNFKKMVQFVQITWKSDHIERRNNPKEILRNLYGKKKLMYFEIKSRKKIQEVFVDIEVIIKYKLPEGNFIKKIIPRIICENGPYEASKDGTWGVNPIGALREINQNK